ncbi:MAG: hypothetical protein P3X24_002140, partial [bacterium]|nr:hypothetical protein [bacterium]
SVSLQRGCSRKGHRWLGHSCPSIFVGVPADATGVVVSSAGTPSLRVWMFRRRGRRRYEFGVRRRGRRRYDAKNASLH